MKKSGCLMQIAVFAATFVIARLMWAAWSAASAFLAQRGAPPAVILAGTLLFGLWVFGVITKFSIFVSMPTWIRLAPANLQEFAPAPGNLQPRAPLPDPLEVEKRAPGGLPLDAWTLEVQTRELETLGFVHVMDFKIEANRPLPPGFARLFAHHGQGCMAEVHQIFPQTLGAQPLPVTCSISSRLQGQSVDEVWTLGTSNAAKNSGSGVSWAMRRPRDLWSRHPGWTPAQLLAQHLADRTRMASDLKLQVDADLSWETYCARGAVQHQARRQRLLRRFGVAIWLESLFCRNKTQWWGDWAARKAGAQTA